MDQPAADIRQYIENIVTKDLRRVNSLFRREESRALLFWNGEELLGLEIRQGVIITESGAPLTKAESEDIEKAAFYLRESGIKSRKAVFIIATPDLRYTVRHYPDMTPEELEETFYWDEDRAFAVKEPMQLATHPIEHTPEGWTAVLAGIRKETFSLWKEGLEKGGFRIEKMAPAIGLGKGPVILYGRRKTAFCLVKKEKERVWRVFHKETAAEKGPVFIRHMEEVLGIKNETIPFVPLAACPREDWPFWESLGDKSGERVCLIRNIFTSKEERNEILKEALTSPLDFMASIKQEEKEKIKPLRRSRWIVLTGLAVLAAGLAQWGGAAWQLRKSEEKLSELQPVMMMKKKIEKENKEAREAARQMNEAMPYSWLEVFSMISDTIPDSLRLDSVISSNESILLQGTGQDRDSVAEFASRLAALGGGARIAESAAQQETGKVQYTIDWKIKPGTEK